MIRLIVLALAFVGLSGVATSAQERPPSTCLAVAENIRDLHLAPVQFASFTKTGTEQSKYEVAISFQGHSTYLIETAGGAKIATDYAGYLTVNTLPNVVTMNQAHSSHYTAFPNPKIEHVLRGWAPDGPAEHYLQYRDVLVRNVTTDLLRFAAVPDGNSIFIFEAAGLCIGHLGHLHHK